MLLPLKVLAPAEAVEHMVDWSMVALSLGLEQDGGQDYAIGVSIIVNPKLAKDLEAQAVAEPEKIMRQVLYAAQQALNGFLGGSQE
jgi:hypothetical protein